MNNFLKKSEINEHWLKASKWMLLTILILVIASSCSKDEKTSATITFIDPTEQDLHGSSWAVGDSMIVVFQAEIESGKMLPVEMGIGRYRSDSKSARKPEEILISETFRTNQQLEIFTIRWKLLHTMSPSREGTYYRLLISASPESQPIGENPPLMIPIQVMAESS